MERAGVDDKPIGASVQGSRGADAEGTRARGAPGLPGAPGGSGAQGARRRVGVWTVALRPEFGPWALSVWQRSIVIGLGAFVSVLIVSGAAIVLSLVLGVDPESTFLTTGAALIAIIALVCVWTRSNAGRAWRALSTPEGVRDALARTGRSWEDNEHDRALGAVRAAWPAHRRPRWERLQSAAAAFDLAAPRAVMIDPTGRFITLPRESSPDPREPEDVGGWAGGETAKRRLLSLPTLGVLLLLVYMIANRFMLQGISVRGALMPTAIIVVVLLLEIFRPARRRLIPGLDDTVLAAPSLVVVRSLRRTVVFRADDSVLVLARHHRRMGETAVTLTRDDGQRVALQYASADDPRLVTLWSLWLHPGSSRWDDANDEIVPEHAPR